MATFVPGRALAAAFYREVIQPIVGDTPHSATLIGWGSDVLGFDIDRSADHGWDPCLQLFVEQESLTEVKQAVNRKLPKSSRTAEVGDQLGSRVIAARLVRDVMRLCFLLERRYASYSKWLGSAFAYLDIAAPSLPPSRRPWTRLDHPARKKALVTVYEHAARHQNGLDVATQIDPTPRLFHSRPYRVLDAGRLASVY